MTGRTHDIAALAAVSLAAHGRPLPALDACTLAACAFATFAGGLAPDLDKPGSTLWRRIPGGSILAWLVRPAFMGGHRHLSHSALGAVLVLAVVRALLALVPKGVLDPAPVWTCFALGYLSHLVVDSLTEGGIPWFFPFGGRVGFPPFRPWRARSNGWFEHLVAIPLLWGAIFWAWQGRLPEILTLLGRASGAL
ncbi:MAG: metal-dependent hydrolase [Armatimonadota bacterium]|nr:metal-dependent hydrolase [Armatimonadota bacterium]